MRCEITSLMERRGRVAGTGGAELMAAKRPIRSIKGGGCCEQVTFDYTASAELFMPKRKGGARPPLSYRRFATAAEAIRFAVEGALSHPHAWRIDAGGRRALQWR